MQKTRCSAEMKIERNSIGRGENNPGRLTTKKQNKIKSKKENQYLYYPLTS